VRSVFVAFLFIFISSCGKISGGITQSRPKIASNDFLMTEIVTNSPGIANGVSDLIVLIHIKNSDGAPVANYRPEFSITSGVGLTSGSCTLSSSQGVAVCILRATQPGVRTLQLTNARVGLSTQIRFDLPSGGKQVIGLASAGQQRGTTASGYQVEASAGHLTDRITVKTARGYTGYLSIQGTVVSR